MKKMILSLIATCALFSTVHAQTTVVVQRPGLLTDLADAVGSLIALPVALAEGIVVGTAEAAGAIIHGSSDVYVVQPAPVVAPAPVVVQPAPVVAPAPVIVQPAPVVAPAPVVVQPAPVVAPAPVVVQPAPVVATQTATTTITTTTRSPGGLVTTTVTRPVSSYELGVPVAPVPVEYRVGTSPYVNPYVFRYR